MPEPTSRDGEVVGRWVGRRLANESLDWEAETVE